MSEAAETQLEPEAPAPGAASPLDFENEVRTLRPLLEEARDALLRLEELAGGTAKQVGFLPGQVRMLAGKVDGLAASISEPRYRAVLLSLLGVYDLVYQLLRSSSQESIPESEGAHRRNYEVILTQLRQTLEENGLTQIPIGGAFDPTLHRALQQVPVDDPAKADQILEVVRPGFRTEHSILRYADVVVGRYADQTSEGGAS